MAQLNEQIVLDFYLKELENDKISFLKNREYYKSKVIKYIIELKECKEMNSKIIIAKDLWKVLFEAAMSYIDPDKRGYDKLFDFFDSYVNFEELIFASDSFYRDHTIHCLWVYFLSEYLYKHDEFKCLTKEVNQSIKSLLNLKDVFKKSDMFGEFKEIVKVLEELTKIKESEDSIRCIVSITHDLGYPLKKISKINRSIGEILPYFSVRKYNEFDFQFDNIQSFFMEDFIEFISNHISAKLSIDDKKYNELLSRILTVKNLDIIGLNEDEVNKLNKEDRNLLKHALMPKFVINKNITKQMRYFKDLEQYKHGIMSAFLLIKTVDSFNSMTYEYVSSDNLENTKMDINKIIAVQDILTSISDHTSDSYQITSINDTSSLLTFTDELEEFSRISRADQNRQYINEFCKTDIYTKDGVLHINFIFDNEDLTNLNPELAFKGRCKRFLKLFNIPKLNEKLKINLKCIGKLSSDNNIYELELRRKYVDIKINGKEQCIPEYLKDRQFYTKEEYMMMK